MGLRQFLTIENPLKMMKNAFYFILRALFVLEIVLTFFYLEKRLDKKAMINFKTHYITD